MCKWALFAGLTCKLKSMLAFTKLEDWARSRSQVLGESAAEGPAKAQSEWRTSDARLAGGFAFPARPP